MADPVKTAEKRFKLRITDGIHHTTMDAIAFGGENNPGRMTLVTIGTSLNDWLAEHPGYKLESIKEEA